MGCHTWFYNKITVSEDDVLNTVINGYEESIKFQEKIINQDESIKDLLEFYKEWTKKYGQKYFDIFSRQLRMIKKGLCKEAVNYKYCEFINTKLIEYVPNIGFFEEVGDFHDVFRKYGYPEDRLYSLEETLKYIDDPENNCEIFINSRDKLKEFWNKYPEGMIEFG